MAVIKDHAPLWVHNDNTNSGFVDSSEGVGQKGRTSSTTDRHRAGILDGHRDQLIRRLRLLSTVTAGDGTNQKGAKMGAGYVNLRKKGKGSRGRWDARRKDQLEPSGTSSLCLGITWHPCDKIHAVIVRQPSAAESCKKMGR